MTPEELVKINNQNFTSNPLANVYNPPATPPAISLNTLNSTATPLNLPNQPQEPDYASIMAGIPTVESITSEYDKPSQTENSLDALTSQLLSSAEKMTQKKSAQLKAEEAAGLPGFQNQLRDVNGQLQALQKEALAIPLQLQEQSKGRGITEGGLAPIQTGQLRQNAIKSLTLSAIAQTLQGNVAGAQAAADRAVDIEFAPEEARLQFLQTAYGVLNDRLSREDRKRETKLNIQLSERDKLIEHRKFIFEQQLAERNRILEEQKETKKFILSTKMEAAKYGATPELLQAFDYVTDEKQALTLAGQYLGAEWKAKQEDMKFNQDMQKATYNLSVKRFEEERRQFGEQMALRRQEIAANAMEKKMKEAIEQGKEDKANQMAVDVLNEKLKLVHEIQGHSGLNSAVGPMSWNRNMFGAFDRVTGATQAFAGKVHQLTSQATIDTLKNLKASGATLGALNQQELDLLLHSTTAINSWELTEGETRKGVWGVDEKTFKDELANIERLTKKAIGDISGESLITPDKNAALDSLFMQQNSLSTGSSPASFY